MSIELQGQWLDPIRSYSLVYRSLLYKEQPEEHIIRTNLEKSRWVTDREPESCSDQSLSCHRQHASPDENNQREKSHISEPYMWPAPRQARPAPPGTHVEADGDGRGRHRPARHRGPEPSTRSAGFWRGRGRAPADGAVCMPNPRPMP